MSQRDKPRHSVVANTLNLFRNGASPLAKTFGVGFIDWLDADVAILGAFESPMQSLVVPTKAESCNNCARLLGILEA